MLQSNRRIYRFLSQKINVKHFLKIMKTWCTFSQKSLNQTAASLHEHSLAAYDQCNYLTHLNYKLVNEINDAETEKYFYRNRLNYELRNHTSELEEAYRVINQKNAIILNLEEQIDVLKKEFRSVEDEFLHVKNQSITDKEHFKKEMDNMDRKCRQKVQKTEQSLQKQHELKTNRRIDQVTRECQDRIKMYNSQIQQLTQNSTQLSHQLKQMQDQHRQMLLKNDILIQETINRQLRKRDYQAQNNYLRDVSQYEALLKDKREIKEEMENLESKLKLVNRKNCQLEALLEAERTKYANLVELYESQKEEKQKIQGSNYHLSRKYADTAEADTNTDQQFVPVVMPVDLDIMSEIVALKQFVVEKIVHNFLVFFNKTAVTDPKKKSLSLTTFKTSIQTLKQTNPQTKILLYIQSNLQRVTKLYCPSMTYSKQYLTLKDQFIKRTLMQCETIPNKQNVQRLYRVLELINRIRNPLLHGNMEISPGELRLVERKFLGALARVFGESDSEGGRL